MQTAKIVFRNMDGTPVGTMTFRKTASQARKKKKLQYNFKELSGRIMQVRTSGNAGQVLILARSKAALLRQKLRCGEYDDKELESAILHADAMVRVARRRMKHLRAEEEAERGIKSRAEDARVEQSGSAARTAQENAASEQEARLSSERQKLEMEAAREAAEELAGQLRASMERAMEEMMEKTMSDTMEETLQDLAGGAAEMKPEDLELLKKKHRAEEQREIMLADMQYLKALFDRLAKEKQSGGSGLSGTGGEAAPDAGAVSLQLGGMDVPVEAAAPVDAAVGGSVDIAI